MNFVIGSGPAGVAVTKALLDQGLPVTMLDSGLTLEASNQELLESITDLSPAGWVAATRAAWRSDQSAGAVPKKLCYGSDFAYRDAGHQTAISRKGVCVNSSFALGGLSNVWGAAVLPYRETDIAAWPPATRDLAPHYRAMFELMPLAAVDDELAGDLLLHGAPLSALGLSRQAQALVVDLTRGNQALAAQGVTFGRSRLAVYPGQPDIAGDPSGQGCAYCGLCLRGCPRRLIYNSAISIEQFLHHPNFSYVGNYVLEDLREQRGQVLLRGIRDGRPAELAAARVYLACGVLGSARIMLASMNAFGQQLRIKDSQYFLAPMLRFAGTPDVQGEALHTLSQVFMEMDGRATGAMPAHLQFYGYNDMYLEMLQNRLGPLFRLGGAMMDGFLSRLLVIQGYLHSDDSSEIFVVLQRGASGNELSLVAATNPQARVIVSRILRKLSANRRRLGGQVLSPLMQFGKPGEGSHIGGLFPMRDCPGEFEADKLGRVRGFSRVHIVDASVLPSIPATTITLPVMANAHRIGCLHRETASDLR